MHWVISGSFGPTDPMRAMLPFLFAASAVQAGDSVTLMLFHDAVLMAVDGVGKTLVPVGPPNRYEEIAVHAKVTLWACRPCVEARGRFLAITLTMLRSGQGPSSKVRTISLSRRKSYCLKCSKPNPGPPVCRSRRCPFSRVSHFHRLSPRSRRRAIRK
jgi:tRNA 2-thiouridine synthesizing protein D